MEDDFLEIEYERRDLDSEYWLCTGCDEHYNYCQCDD